MEIAVDIDLIKKLTEYSFTDPQGFVLIYGIELIEETINEAEKNPSIRNKGAYINSVVRAKFSQNEFKKPVQQITAPANTIKIIIPEYQALLDKAYSYLRLKNEVRLAQATSDKIDYLVEWLFYSYRAYKNGKTEKLKALISACDSDWNNLSLSSLFNLSWVKQNPRWNNSVLFELLEVENVL